MDAYRGRNTPNPKTAPAVPPNRAELASLRQREAAAHAEPLDVWPADAEPMPTGMGFSGVIWNDRLHVWVRWQNGRPVAAYWAKAEGPPRLG